MGQSSFFHYILEVVSTTAIEKQIKAYLDGFYELVNPNMISIFTPKELELLISGMPDIVVLDLKNNTEYNGYRPADKEIVWFWSIMMASSKSEKASFLQFVTGSSKVPLNGSSELQGMRGIQKFSIHKAGGSTGAYECTNYCWIESTIHHLIVDLIKNERYTSMTMLDPFRYYVVRETNQPIK